MLGFKWNSYLIPYFQRAGSQASAFPTETVVTTRRIETEDSGINVSPFSF